MYSFPDYTPRDTAGSSLKPLWKLVLLAVVLAAIVVAGVWWVNTHPMPNSGPPSITLEGPADVDTIANTFEVRANISGSIPHQMAIFPAQDLGDGKHLLIHSLPYAAYNAQGVEITGTYIDVQGRAELVFLLVSRSDANDILEHQGAGAADGFKMVDEKDLDGSAKILRPDTRVMLY